jgi:hypothetical protein
VASTPRSHRSGSEARQRAGVIGFRANAAERAELEAAAERVGLTLGSYIRARALAKPATRATRRPTVEQAALAQLLAQLGKCGSNLNQMARVLNSGGDVPRDIPEALADFRAACADIMRALGREPHPSAVTDERRGAA